MTPNPVADIEIVVHSTVVGIVERMFLPVVFCQNKGINRPVSDVAVILVAFDFLFVPLVGDVSPDFAEISQIQNHQQTPTHR